VGATPSPEKQLVREAQAQLLDLAVSIGIMEAAMFQHEQYELALEGWRQRLREMRDWASRQQEELHDFAESFD
jgi:hypothetical protein